jgi:hypothetical protein
MMKRRNEHSVSGRAEDIASLEFFIEVAMLVPLPSSSLPLSKLIKDSRVRIGRFSTDRGYNEMTGVFVPSDRRARNFSVI